MMSRLKLTVNESKTRVCRLPQEKFDFLGYTFGRCYSPGLLGHDSVQETSAAYLQGDQRDDPPESSPAGGGNAGRCAQPED
jgi:hypothetical protein